MCLDWKLGLGDWRPGDLETTQTRKLYNQAGNSRKRRSRRNGSVHFLIPLPEVISSNIPSYPHLSLHIVRRKLSRSLRRPLLFPSSDSHKRQVAMAPNNSNQSTISPGATLPQAPNLHPIVYLNMSATPVAAFLKGNSKNVSETGVADLKRIFDRVGRVPTRP